MNEKKRIPLDLQLFATAGNTTGSNTTGNDLSTEMKTYYSSYLIDMAGPLLVHDQFGQKHPIPKPIGNTFSARFWRFLVISYLFHLRFDDLISTVSGCSGAVCGNLCGQKRFPPGFR